jgi:DNA-directed RNA polymerase specialized sigma24 family protein
MDAREQSRKDLDDLHELFLTLRRADSAARLDLIHQIVLHPATHLRLTEACCIVLKHRAAIGELREDVMQGAMLVLIERLTANNLAFRDEGPDRFGGWLYFVCRSACLDAWKQSRPLSMQSILLVDAGELAKITVRPQEGSRWDHLLEAIDSIADQPLRDVMLEWVVAGSTVRESASQRDISVGSVFNLRQRGARLIREQEPGV